MQTITIAGRLGSDAKLAHTQGGDSVLNFNVAVDYRNGRDKATNWYRCAMWGKRADALAQYLRKGTPVAVSGEFGLTEYEGKPQLNVRVGEVTMLGKVEGGAAPDGGSSDPSNMHGGAGRDDLDDDIPF